jgi:hypothetical protein
MTTVLEAPAAPAVERAECEHCRTEMDADELQPDHNGDPTCTDCLSSWAGQDDDAEYRHYATH